MEIVLNAWLDTSSPTTHTVRVVSKLKYRDEIGRGMRTKYMYDVQSWQREGETETLTGYSLDYDVIVPGQTRVVVLTKPGRFGLEWIADVSMARP